MLVAFLKPFAGIIASILVVLLVLGGPLVWWWDRRPEGLPAVHLLFLTWRAPDSLRAQRDAARAALGQCHSNVAALEGAVGAQNAAVAAMKARGDVALAQARAGMQAYEEEWAAAVKARASIAAPLAAPTGPDAACQRAREVDGRFVESLQ